MSKADLLTSQEPQFLSPHRPKPSPRQHLLGQPHTATLIGIDASPTHPDRRRQLCLNSGLRTHQFPTSGKATQRRAVLGRDRRNMGAWPQGSYPEGQESPLLQP